jgi:triosephosphate isomerase
MHATIRGWLQDNFPAFVAKTLRIQYGGSVRGSNAAELMQMPDIDGALVGGASLVADDFIAIVHAAG